MKVGYFGLPLGAFLLLMDGHELDPCVLSPLDAPGRRRVAARLARERLIDCRGRPASSSAPEIERALSRARPDLIVSWFWTRLLPAAWLSAARLGGIGVHPSLLPRHRGPNPYFWTIDAGDLEAGVTLHTLAPKYDTGAIRLQRSIPVGERNSWQLARALDRPSLALLREGVRRFAKGNPPSEKEQRGADATWAPEPTGRELLADWAWPTARVLRRIRALAPVPGLAVDIHGLRFFVTRARSASDFVVALEPGEAAVMGQRETLVIRTADGAVAVERAQLGADDLDTDEDSSELELNEESLAAAVAARLSVRSG
ncbi:MAG TPA: formyltransferase family protein [Polyangiaceae bacterium]|nr:formyltransferase family protein [Polyangiaceae bacterium]